LLPTTAAPAARLELAREGGHLRFQTGRGGGGFGEVLVRQRQGEVIGDPAREVDVVLGEAIDVARGEEERAEDAGAERQRHPHGGPRADAREPPRLRAALAELFVGVVDV
jgi:hypothetical protein